MRLRSVLLGASTILAVLGGAMVAPAFADAPRYIDRQTRNCAQSIAGKASCQTVRIQKADERTGTPMAFTSTSGITASKLRTAYGITTAGAPSTVVAIVDAYDSPSAYADLVAYRAAMGLPAMDQCTLTANAFPATGRPCFAKVNQNGATSPLPVADAGWAQEISLDVDMAAAVCPMCSILLVEASSPTFADLGAAVTTASNVVGVRAISNSYGSAVGTDASATSSSPYVIAAAKGIAVTVSSGDSGYGISYPASIPQVIAVGGTSLRLNADGSIASETAWSGAGSGCSTYSLALSWQLTGTGCGSRRGTTDISAVADPATGVSVYYAGSWMVFGGTSVSAPIVGAWLAVNGTYSSTTSASQYVWGRQWRDITSGTNGSCTPAVLCTAGAGWDGPTGLGSLPPVTSTPVTPPPPPAPAATTTTLSVSPSTTVTSGASVSLTASVSSTSMVTGTVTFNDGASLIGTATLSSGRATVTTSSLAVGAHSITASYAATSAFAASSSAATTVTVNAPPRPVAAVTTTTLSVSPSTTVTSGASVSLTASVSSTSMVTGTVTFNDGASVIGTAMLSNGRATVTTASLAVGAHSITASYAATSAFAASSSAATTVTVNAPPPVTTGTVPAAPGTPTIALGTSRGTLAVAWTAPVSDGGSAIKYYCLYLTNTNNRKVTRLCTSSLRVPTVTSVTVSGVQGGSYTVRVSAVNALGEGALSASSLTLNVNGEGGGDRRARSHILVK